MRDDDYKRIFAYGVLAMRLLKEGSIPPTPQFYELLFTYASGTNTALNKRINSVLKSGERPDTDLVGELCREFLHTQAVDERLDHVSTEIVANIQTVNGAINEAAASANSYSGLLQSASGDLEAGIGDKDLALLTSNLLTETRNMQSTNAKLEDSLESAQSQIAALQDELEKVRLESMLDPLTKIRNREAFDRQMEASVAKAQVGGATLILMMVDIDHFKAFNDNYGHQTGDQVIRLVAHTLDTHTKDSDIAARYGGEEFAVILHGVLMHEAIEIAERLRLAIRQRELLKRSTQETLGKISASFGLAMYRPGDTVASIIERADACLYAAKRNGRNQVVEEDQLDKLEKAHGNAA